MINALKTAAIAAAVALAAFTGGYFYGKRDGEMIASIKAVETTVKVLQTRGKIDEEINAVDALVLCRHYGLQDDDERECLRRVEETNAKGGNRHNDNGG